MSERIIILSGPPGSGKTTACRQLAALAQKRRLDCAGLVCPARFQASRKVGIDVLDLRTGESRPLAEADHLPAALRTGAYRFDVEAVAWGVAVLDAACPCDLLVVDEIGPLELERGLGWANALNVLRDGQFGLAVVVVRPGLLDVFHIMMGDLSADLFTLPACQLDAKRLVAGLLLLHDLPVD